MEDQDVYHVPVEFPCAVKVWLVVHVCNLVRNRVF